MIPQIKPEPRIWAIVTIAVAIIGCLGLIGQSFITVLPDLLNKTAEKPAQILDAIMLGQDGYDYVVSGCQDGMQGSIGIIDNHIRLSGVEKINDIEQIEIQYGNFARWQYPCKYPTWEIFMNKSSEGVLELYFEPESDVSQEVTFSIILTYKDGTVITTTVVGASGENVQ